MLEVGHVFYHNATVADSGLSIAGYAQPAIAGGILYGPVKEEQWDVRTRPVNFSGVKGDVESLPWPLQTCFEYAEHPASHPGRPICVVLDDRAIGWIGKLHPCWLQEYDVPTTPVMWELEFDAVIATGLPKYHGVPRVPTVTHDIALVVRQGVAVQDLVNIFGKTATGTLWEYYLQGAVLFSEFHPKATMTTTGMQEKNLAFRITL